MADYHTNTLASYVYGWDVVLSSFHHPPEPSSSSSSYELDYRHHHIDKQIKLKAISCIKVFCSYFSTINIVDIIGIVHCEEII